MLEWKMGKVFQQDYLLKIACEAHSEGEIQGVAESMYKLILFKKGTSVLTINNRNFVMTSPSVVCLNDQDEVVCMHDQNKCLMDIIYFHPSVINFLFDCENVRSGAFNADWTSSANQDRFLLLPFFERKHAYKGCLRIEMNAFNKVLVLFNKLQEQMQGEIDDFWPCRSRSYLIEILIMIQMKYLDNSDTEEFLEIKDSEKELNVILDFIHSSYASKITIDLLTKQFGINRNTLNQCFSELTGYTPIAYLIKHRLKVAESLLINTQVPVHEICERVGFSELSNFMRSFKKHYGEAPATYRNRYTTMW